MARNSPYRTTFKVRKGGLHDWARRTQGWSGKDSDTLPQDIKDKAASSKNPHTKKMGIFAQNFGGK